MLKQKGFLEEINQIKECFPIVLSNKIRYLLTKILKRILYTLLPTAEGYAIDFGY